MIKKIFVWFLILIGCGALFVAGSALVLMLAPGTEIFGIRYIGSGRGEFSFEQNLANFDGNIYIETNEVPISINYSQYASYYISYHQNFNGFTNSKYKSSSVDYNIDEFGNLIVKVNELRELIKTQELVEDYNFILRLPPQARTKSIYVKSNESNVTINISNNVGNVEMDNFDVVTKGDFVLNGSIKATNFKLHTTKSIVVSENVNCTNVDLNSYGGNIIINKPLTGNIVAKTSVGDIKFVTAKTLTAKTGSGNISCATSGLNSVQGSVDIKTSSGKIQLGNVSYNDLIQDRKATIVSNSGEINISTLFDATITSERGKVLIGEANNLIINANVGNVEVREVRNTVIVNGRNGKVSLGEGGKINNVTVKTSSGVIDVRNTTGEVYLKSTSNSVSLLNESSAEITLYSIKDLKATNLQGVVNIYTNGDATLHFKDVNGNVEIETGGKTNTVSIDATCQKVGEVNYSLESTKGKKAKVYAGEELLAEKSKIESTSIQGVKLIRVKTSYAVIVLKLGSSV